MLASTPGRGRGMTVDVCYDSDKPHHHAGEISATTSPSHKQYLDLSSTSSVESPVKLAANFVSYDSRSDQLSPHTADKMQPPSPPTAQQQWQQQHSLLPQHKHILQQHHQAQQQHLQLQQEFIMLRQQQQQQIREDTGYQQQHKQRQDYQIQHQSYPSPLNKSQQVVVDDTLKQFQQHNQQDTLPRPQQQHNQQIPSNNSHPQQIRILQRQPQQQLQQQQGRQQQRSTTSPPQVSFPGTVAPSLFPPNISPVDLTSFIDTSVPPPPIGVPIPGLHFPVSAKSPPLMYTTTTAFHAQPPRPTIPCEPSPYQAKTSPDLQHPHRYQPVKWQPDANGDHGSSFTSIQDSPWDNIELGGGYSSPLTLDTGLRGPSPVTVPKAVDLSPSQGPSQKDHFQTKKISGQNRDATQGAKQWNKTKGRGNQKKDIKGSQYSKPHQGHNAFSQGYGTPPSGMGHSYQACQGQGSTKQQQDASKSALQLSKEQKKNEYEWQSFKIIRKVRKLLGGLKEDSGKEREIAAEIVGVMQAESSRLACFPWPKEQFVALDEILGWVMDNSELLDKICKVIQELHCLHPQNFQEDLLNTVMKRQLQYIKVSTATNKDKLYVTFCGLLTRLFTLSRSATNGLNNIIDNLLDSIVTKWITCDLQGTADDPGLLTEVYASCLSALFVNIGPQLASSMDQRYYQLLRDQVLGGKPRFVKEAMLNLLLLRAADWQEEAFSKKNAFPEDAEGKQNLEEIPNMVQRCGPKGEGTKVPDEVNQTKEVPQVGTVTTKSEDTTKTDQTRPSVEMTAPAVEVPPSIPPSDKNQPDNLQSLTVFSPHFSHSSSNNNSNSIQDSVAPPQNLPNSKADFQLPVHSVAAKETNQSTSQMFFIPGSRSSSHGLPYTTSINSSYNTTNQQEPPSQHSTSSHTNNLAQPVTTPQATKQETLNPKSTTASPSRYNLDHSIPSHGTSQPQDRPQLMQTKPTSDVRNCLPLDNLQSNGSEDTKPLSSSLDIYGPPYTSKGTAFHNSNDIPSATAYIQQERKLSSPSRVAGTATQPRSSPASGRGMMRFEQSIGTTGSFLTSPLAFIQSGPPRDAAFRRGDFERPEKETTKDKLSKDHVAEVGQFSTVRPAQDSKPSSAVTFSQDGCEERPTHVESLPGADGNVTEDLGELGNWLNHSQESFEEINDEYFASHQDNNQRSSQVNPEESNGQQDTEGERQTSSMAGEVVSEKQRDEQELKVSVSSDVDLGSHDPLTPSSNIPMENSHMKPASIVSGTILAGLGQDEKIEASTASDKPASQQVIKCSLCGSDKHRTRQCATFKKYAPHVKTSDCDPETTEIAQDGVQEPKREKFGSVIFCSKCGKKGHLIYDCPIKGSFNIFLKNNDTII